MLLLMAAQIEMPPLRFQGNATAIVRFVTDVGPECANAPEGYLVLACSEGPVIIMPNPCRYPNERYARLLCHEIGHLNFWGKDHPK